MRMLQSTDIIHSQSQAYLTLLNLFEVSVTTRQYKYGSVKKKVPLCLSF